MAVAVSSETLLPTYRTIRRQIPYTVIVICSVRHGANPSLIRGAAYFAPNLSYELDIKCVMSCKHVTRQRHVNNNKNNIGMVFSTLSVPMATMEYGMPPLRNNCTATEERYFVRGLCRDVTSEQSVNELEDCCGTVIVSYC
jgi:hypothetical protein